MKKTAGSHIKAFEYVTYRLPPLPAPPAGKAHCTGCDRCDNDAFYKAEAIGEDVCYGPDTN